MSVFTSQIRYKPWLGQVTILSMIMGGLLALSLKTQDKIRHDKAYQVDLLKKNYGYTEPDETPIIVRVGE